MKIDHKPEIRRIYSYIGFITLCVLIIATVTSFIPQTTYYANNAQNSQIEQEMTITAYSEIDSCHYPGCIMASGRKAYLGAIACPRDIPLGTIVKIEYKKYTCEDRYNKNLSRRFDIFMGYGKTAHKEALEFGRQKLLIAIKN